MGKVVRLFPAPTEPQLSLLDEVRSENNFTDAISLILGRIFLPYATVGLVVGASLLVMWLVGELLS